MNMSTIISLVIAIIASLILHNWARDMLTLSKGRLVETRNHISAIRGLINRRPRIFPKSNDQTKTDAPSSESR